SRPRDQAGPTAAGTGRARRTAHHSAPADPAAVAADGLQRARPGHRGEPARRAGAAPDRRAARRRLPRPPGQPPGARRRAGERRLRLVQRPHSRRQPVRALRNAQRAAGPHPGAGGSRPVGTAGTAQARGALHRGTAAGACPADRRPGLRARLDHRPGHRHRHPGDRRPVLAADGARAGGSGSRHRRGHPARRPHLLHPHAPQRRPCPARGGRPMNSLVSRTLCALLAMALLAGCGTPPESRLSSLAALPDEAPARRDLNIQQRRTAEGARVLFVEARELPMFDLRLTFAAGSSQDRGVHGLALLTNAMLNEGVRGKDADAIAAGFESLGAEFGNGAYRDMAVVSLRSLSDPQRREPALALLAEVVGKPMFPADALERIRNQLLASIESNRQSPGKWAIQALFAALYGPHPYGHPCEGTAKSLQGIRQAQLRDFHRRAYTAGNAVIALVGDLSRSEAEAIAAQVSSALPAGRALPKTEEPRAPAPVHRHVEFPSNQTHLQIAQLGIERGHPDYAALFLGNQILGGGGFGS